MGAVGGALYICNNITAVLVFPLAATLTVRRRGGGGGRRSLAAMH